MKTLIFLFGLLHLSLSNNIPEQRLASICYDGYGCFTTNAPFNDLFYRPISFLPQSPVEVGTKFFLHTRDNPNPNGVQISATSVSVHFKQNRPTRIIAPGYLSTPDQQWIVDMKNAILKAEDSNVIVIDWSKGNGLLYAKAVTNTQIVGVEIALLVKSYVSKGLITPDDVHIIGHSLGSHIAGYAGERISPKIGRITGLDPAGPHFENMDIRVRLDPSDAKFVDVIHTDGAPPLQIGLGLLQKSGHVDFYPNGGQDQPKCPPTSNKVTSALNSLIGVDFGGMTDAIACSHMTAVHYYTNSIESGECSYMAYPCNSHSDFKSGKCLTCSYKGCNRMGHWASPNNDLGSLYFTTQDATRLPYCFRHLRITATSYSVAGQGTTKGKFTITLKGTKRQSTTYLLDNEDTTLSAGSVLQSLAETPNDLGTITGATLSFTKSTCFILCWGFVDKWSFKNIEVLDGQSQVVARLCPTKDWITTGGTLDFNAC